jgi:putative redox protein
MSVKATRLEGLAHELTARGHVMRGDEPVDCGGTDTGFSPRELLALSLAACTAITIEMYADRKGWDVGALEVEVDSEHAPERGLTRFDVTLKLPAALTDEQVERIGVIAGKCPVHRTLTGDVEITDRVVRV